MSDYDWDSQIEYLTNTRWLYYNDDYLEFLIQKVWKINKPVKIVDYGCGYGFLGLKLLPLLPEGSTYTGIDNGKDLIEKAKDMFKHVPTQTEFIRADIQNYKPQCEFDIAVCHAFLLHMTDPVSILQKMMDSVVDSGKLICFEPHWISNMSNYQLEGWEQSQFIQLGILQKLFEQDQKRNGRDGNIGMRIPILLSKLGIKDVECRVSDRVNFLDQNMDSANKKKLIHSLKEEGLGQKPEEFNEFVQNLVERGLSNEEAERQYKAELLFSEALGDQSWLTYAPNMKISFGNVKRS